MAAERDWVGIVAEERCPDCGLCASEVPRADLAAALDEEGRDWGVLLRAADASGLRAHRNPGAWSALEYAAHVRDVLGVFRERVERALAEDHPAFGWWDHEASAVDEQYNAQAPTAVATELELRASRLSSLAGGLGEPDWARTGERRDHEQFTVEGLIRFALHEAHHHRADASRAVGAPWPG